MINMWRTPIQPMRAFVDRMTALEGKDGILSISFGHGFPWGDVEDVGAKILVISDGDEIKARTLAQKLGQEIWAMRSETMTAHDTVDDAISQALKDKSSPVILADVADNAGGGAPSDNTAILHRLVDRGISGAVTGCYWDPQAVQFCMEAGLGATFPLRIGGKCGPASGDPVDLRITVRGLAEDHSQTGLSGGRASFGPSAWVSADGIDIVLVSKRQQTFAPDAFTGLGLTLRDKRMVIVKSTQHFHAAFAPIAGAIRYVSAPGAIPPEFEKIPYTKRTLPYWPRNDDPFERANKI
jgi:microcystin degradation protein MlrC